MTDHSQLQAVLEIMHRNGLFAPQSEEQMQQLLLEVMQFASSDQAGDEWDEFEED